MSIITYTRDRKCKDCMNLRYFHPNPKKYYRRYKCIMKNQPRSLNDKDAVHCDGFEWNSSAIPHHINYNPEKSERK